MKKKNLQAKNITHKLELSTIENNLSISKSKSYRVENENLFLSEKKKRH